MKLYRIILVDDEEEVRKSIIRKIKWEENGFLVAGDAENGEDALEKIEALEPDLSENFEEEFFETKKVVYSQI